MRPMIRVNANRILSRAPTAYERRCFAGTLAEYPVQSIFHRVKLGRARLNRFRRRFRVCLGYTPDMLRTAPTVESSVYIAGRALMECADRVEGVNPDGSVDVIKTRGEPTPVDPLLETDFKHTERVHDWRNHIGEPIRALWATFTPEQRAALRDDAAERASAENWE